MTQNHQLGLRPLDLAALAAAPKFSDFRAKSTAAVSAVLGTQEPLETPKSIDYQSPLTKWQVNGNNDYGDCVAAAWANTRRLLGHKEIYPVEAQCLKFYQTQNPTFNPQSSTNGPHSKADGGMHLTTALEDLMNNGGPDGVKPPAWCSVDYTNLEEVKAAIATFGYVSVGLNMNDNDRHTFDQHRPLSVTAKNHDVGGHCVMAAAYDASSQIKFVSWGGLGTFSNRYWNSLNEDGTPHEAATVGYCCALLWPEHLRSRRFMAGLDVPQLTQQWLSIRGAKDPFEHLDPLPFDSLYMFQTAVFGQPNITLRVAKPGDRYLLGRTAAEQLAVGKEDASNGVFVFESKDIYFIKSRSTAGTIEVHRCGSDTGYSQFDMQFPSAFPASDANNGVWTIDNGDLYLIKTRNTTSGSVEVHAAGHQSQFRTYTVHEAAGKFLTSDAPNGSYFIRGGDLYFKQRNTAHGKTELWVADAEQGYRNVRVFETFFNTGDDNDNFFWHVDNNKNLYYVWKRGTFFGNVVVNVLTYDSGYQDAQVFNTIFEESVNDQGTWVMG